MAQCRGCGEHIEFVTMKKSGKKMPVNAEYFNYDDVEAGTILITDGGNLYTKETDKSFPNIKGRESHFSVCKQASKFRR